MSQYTEESQPVLYIEEITSLENKVDMRCFVIFDKYENEYYITGLRKIDNAVQFKFYTKSKKTAFRFIDTIVEPKCKINYMLYNMSNLEYIDYDILKNNVMFGKEIVGYNSMELSEGKTLIKDTLKILKHVRY